MTHIPNFEDFLNEAKSGLEAYNNLVKKTDWYHMYSDDDRKYRAGKAHESEMRKVYLELKDSDKEQAYQIFIKASPFDSKPEKSQFKGI